MDVDSWNVIHMHDLVRDMGRNVDEKSSQQHRLWSWRDKVDQQSSVSFHSFNSLYIIQFFNYHTCRELKVFKPWRF